ncbi:lipopolysaccharide assembly protein LapA domain-containing protein [Ketogulonicigenium vulgare]|uniref:Lipopolysaccharide assembly protein A domain-containing protein n=1 Tax=Ketogulonicigenium vulgare (strain WSH-001) TaxID=759362 RepID=F9Y9C4_KETVW|nr:lipopolysaccharide assembly protein LapA domain-containing protein [Ketogulonicigenium vulgare]ADO41882.1 conserved hypothetical protein [Ketogulonicigenium vulgare Y25]AEM40106.1 hypothetical protein KVU_0267 [Ketogulonicigenium vulgare WSH-001]ALJ80313.1 phosphoribosylanthranilate isomerase [Ketogulonicigenium vulgare]ANW33150.1 DUF1049 domain-containing protein [Ketogulonicigenium vulgare]AOZ53803.1 hypothetical protein KVC_0786 [Ketogulonicigenium vulgare]
MRLIRLAFWLIVAACLVVLGLANRGMVTLHAIPAGLAQAIGIQPTIQVPLFVAIFFGVFVGLLVGFLWEWIREYPVRAAVAKHRQQLTALDDEVQRLRRDTSAGQGDAEILALLGASKSK